MSMLEEHENGREGKSCPRKRRAKSKLVDFRRSSRDVALREILTHHRSHRSPDIPPVQTLPPEDRAAARLLTVTFVLRPERSVSANAIALVDSVA
jgi:hypothetical protein